MHGADGALGPLAWISTRALGLCRALAAILFALKVLAILVQVFFRPRLVSALAWPEEAARFGAHRMTGLVAPLAYRRGGFAAIDTLERALLPRVGAALGALLTLGPLEVILYARPLSSAHARSGCLFASNTLWVPSKLEMGDPLSGTDLALTLPGDAPSVSFTPGWTKMPLAATDAALDGGLRLLVLVTLEFLLRSWWRSSAARTVCRPCSSPTRRAPSEAARPVPIRRLPFFVRMIGLAVVTLLAAPGIMLETTGAERDLRLMHRNVLNGTDGFPPMTLPFLLLAGEIMNRGIT